MVDETPPTPSEQDPLLPAGRHDAHGNDGSEPLGRTERCEQNVSNGDIESNGLASAFVPKLGACMLNFFVSGVSMAAVGALIPDIEHHYETSDGITAFLFPAGVVGYVAATAGVDPAFHRFGRRGIALLSSTTRILAALLLSCSPSFGILLAAYVGFGFGTGLTDTAWNAWASGMQRPNVLQGLLHGCFSVGCICGPVLALAVLRGSPWDVFYLVIALMSAAELLAQTWAFRHEAPPPKLHSHTSPNPSIPPRSLKPSKSLLHRPSLYLTAIFYFLYQGVEATFTGWIVVYMRRERPDATPTAAGLASSTFWLGMALGRYALGPATERLGVARAGAIYIACTLAAQVALNAVGSAAATMVLLALTGVAVAPLFPSGVVLLVSRLEAREEHMRAVAALIAIGQVGGALATLAVGFMADSIGIKHLFEVMCGLSALMLVTWAAIVRVE